MEFPEDKLGTRIAVLGTEMKSLTEKLDTHTEDQKDDFKVVHKLIAALSKQLDTKYANKWVEKGIIIIVSGVIIGVTVFLVTGG